MPFKILFLLLISKDKVKGNCPFQKHLYYSSCFNEIILHVMVNHHVPIICLRCEILDDFGMPIAASMRAKYEA